MSEHEATEQWRYRGSMSRTSTGKISRDMTVEVVLGPDQEDRVVQKLEEFFAKVDAIDPDDKRLGKDLEASIREREAKP